MIKFLIYLLEAGVCLTLLYLAYLLFFRKETFLNFIRIYLISIVALAIVIPLVHINFESSRINSLDNTFSEIGKFRGYYEELIAMLDPEYYDTEASTGNQMVFEGDDNNSVRSTDNGSQMMKAGLSSQTKNVSNKNGRRNISSILIGIYLIGVLFFFTRLVYLIIWIGRLMNKNRITKNERYKVVEVKEEMPPFSFFKYIFINRKSMSDEEIDQIITHELVHISQKHSIDLIIAHTLAVFQWFNPFAWMLQKDIKTNHEYLADRKVVEKGFALFDYQSLLLTQLVGIRSVELVNNLNLISIKKRLAMMNKLKSGFISKTKALLIVPFALLVFFLFADMTVYGPGKTISNFSTGLLLETSNLHGLWISTDNNQKETWIQIDNNNFWILETMKGLKEYSMALSKEAMILSIAGQEIPLKYTFRSNILTIWWSETESMDFKKTPYDNSIEAFISEQKIDINLPSLQNTKAAERTELCISITVEKDKIKVNGDEVLLDNLSEALTKAKNQINALDLPYATVLLYVDKDFPMQDIYKVTQTLRHNNLLKIAYMGEPQKEDVSKLLYHVSGIAQKLPPLDAKLVETSELHNYFTIDLHKEDVSIPEIKKELLDYIFFNKKYIMIMNFDNKTSYGTYVSAVDMVYDVIYTRRDEYALATFSLPYDELASKQKQQVRKVYPMILAKKNIDED